MNLNWHKLCPLLPYHASDFIMRCLLALMTVMVPAVPEGEQWGERL